MNLAKHFSLHKVLPWLLIVCGTIGLICAFIITVEKIALLENPAHHTICDLNPVVSCGSVMSSDQSHVFGFANSIIGLIAFPVLIATGVAILAGAQFKRWYWRGLQLGTVFGLIFVHWLFYQSVYTIQALCPFCMVVWVVTITAFWYVMLYNFTEGHIRISKKLLPALTFIQKHHLDILVLWLLVITVLILQHFWYYYGSFITS